MAEQVDSTSPPKARPEVAALAQVHLVLRKPEAAGM